MRRWFFIVSMVWSVRAGAVVMLDQQQPLVRDPARDYAIGGEVEQKLAQTVTAGLTGRLVEVQVPIACRSGEVILEIRELNGDRPDGAILSTDIYRASDFPAPGTPPAFQRLPLRTSLFFNAGDRFAIQLFDKSGECVLYRSPDGDSYTRGDAWFVNNTPPTTDWTPQSSTPSADGDYPFKTFVDVPPVHASGGPCTVHGSLGGLPGLPIPFIPDYAPVCRCLQDEGLRDETRCALLNPDFFMFRRTPSIDAGEPFKVTWTLVALSKLKGVIELTELLPDGFQTSLKGPLTFFVDQLPQGASMTLTYDAIAGKKGGKIETSIMMGGQTQQLGTTIEVK